MWRAMARGLLARRLRLALSALAVVLGVAFVTGSQIFNATLNQTLMSIVAGTANDVQVGVEADDTGTGAPFLTRPEVPGSVVDAVAALPEVAQAAGVVGADGIYVLDHDHQVLGGPGTPKLGFSYDEVPVSGGRPGLRLTEGTAPTGSREVNLDPATAETGGIFVGDRITVITPFGGAQEYTVSGLAANSAPSFGGATVTVFDTEAAQVLIGDRPGYFHSISVAAAQGVDQEELAAAVEAALPTDLPVRLTVLTADDAVAEAADDLSEQMGFMSVVLYGFAAVSVLVGAFLIVNTFAMLVAQRRRELALLRAVGARSGQVLRWVLAEALVLGVLASALGVAAGIGLAWAVIRLFAQIGLDITGTGVVLEPAGLALAFGIGVVVTLVAAWIPARATARIAPVEALQVAEVRRGLGRSRVVVGAALLVTGLLALVVVIARTGPDGVTTVLLGGGMVLVLWGLVLVSPLVGRPFIRGAGVLLGRLTGRVGSPARLNAERNPRRTGATASALMVGLALVATMTVVGATAQVSLTRLVAQGLSTDLVVATPTNAALPAHLAEVVQETAGVGSIMRVALLPARVDGQDEAMTAESSPGTLTRVDVLEGTLADLDADHVAVQDTRAQELDLTVGDQVAMTSNGQTRELAVAAVFWQPPQTMAPWLGDEDLAAGFGWPRQDVMVGVDVASGHDPDEVRSRVTDAVADVPLATVYDNASFAEMRAEQVAQLVQMVYVLLALAVVIALLGVVNTLALSVVERTRELGLLRGVGMRRAQVRQMIRLESVLISLLGAGLGVAAGLLFGVAVQRAMVEEGLIELAVPWAQLGVFLVVAAVVGVLAALWPAVRASRVDILDAIEAT